MGLSNIGNTWYPTSGMRDYAMLEIWDYPIFGIRDYPILGIRDYPISGIRRIIKSLEYVLMKYQEYAGLSSIGNT